MTQEDKELLLQDLCCRLPYGVKLKITLDLSYDTCYDSVEQSCTFNATLYSINIDGEPNDILIHHDNEDTAIFLNEKFQECPIILEDWIPYLRPMSSMTEDEYKEYRGTFAELPHEEYLLKTTRTTDWLNKNMFDYRGLIKKGLALEAPEGMYKIG